MRRFHASSVVALVMSLSWALLAAPVAAAPATTTAPILTQALSEAATLLGMDSRGMPLTPAATAATLPQVIAERWDAEVLTTAPPVLLGGTSALATPALADQGEEDGDPSGSFATAGRLSYDATGDGLADVAGFHLNFDTGTTELLVLDGATGETVFTTPRTDFTGWTVFAVSDRSGDGITDLIQLRLVEEQSGSTCVEDAGGYDCTFDETFTWAVDLVSGADGAILRSRTQDGYFRGYDRADAAGYAYHIEALNLRPAPEPTGDHDGDGIDELIVVDEQIVISGSDDSPRSADIDTTATVLDAGWSALATFQALDRPTFPYLRRAGDLTGDGTPELVWSTSIDLGFRIDSDCPGTLPEAVEELLGMCSTRSMYEAEARVEVIDGTDFSVIQDLRVRDGDGSFLHAFPVVHQDLDDDGAADLRLYTWDFERTETMVLDAGTGEVRWQHASEDVLGSGQALDLDGDGETELVMRGTLSSSSSSPTSESTTSTFFQTVLDGATGEEEARQAVSVSKPYAADGWVLFFGFLREVDLNGDGIPDPVFRDVVGDYDADSETMRYETVLRVLDATDIERPALVNRDAPGIRVFTTTVMPAAPALPTRVEFTYPGPEVEGGFALIDGESGAPTMSLEQVDWVSTLPNPDGSEDLLLTEISEEDQRLTSVISRARQGDLATVWLRTFGR